MKENKLIIGCANVGNFYGVNEKEINSNKFNKIFKTAIKNKIFNFDTANSYANSQEIIGEKIFTLKKRFQNFNIDSKISKDYQKNSLTYEVMLALHSTKIDRMNIMYFHDAKVLLKKNGKKIYNELALLKKNKLINKIGISVYSLKEAKQISKRYKIDAIQIPINFLDRRFLKSNFLSYLKKKKIEIIGRSIFLKGILAKNLNKLPKYFLKYRKEMKQYDDYCKKNKFDRVKLCLDFVQNLTLVDKFIVGVSSEKQLKTILSYLKQTKYSISNFKLNKPSLGLLDPRCWNINS
jgi:aryl-alcohol dehydrogenase-like predicted oxidoreductase